MSGTDTDTSQFSLLPRDTFLSQKLFCGALKIGMKDDITAEEGDGGEGELRAPSRGKLNCTQFCLHALTQLALFSVIFCKDAMFTPLY